MAATRHGAQLTKFLGKEDDNLVGFSEFVRM
jgi:hypothetical protein